MMNSHVALASLRNPELLARTREIVKTSCHVEADLLLHLGEIDERKLYLEQAFPSMFAFCVSDLRFSEDAAYNRILVARAARRLPAIIEAIRSRQVHLFGLRLLVPHLTEENHVEVLAEAAGKSKREVELLVARLSPRPPAPTIVRRLPEAPVVAPSPEPGPALVTDPVAERHVSPTLPRRDSDRPVIAPLTEKTFKIQFTAPQQFHDDLRKAQDLLRHRVPDGDLTKVLGAALKLLIAEVEKERFAVGRQARSLPENHGKDDANRIRLLCRAHNQHAADRMYGRQFMDRARAWRPPASTCSGTSPTESDSSPAESGADMIARPAAAQAQFAYG
jgi:hypothetical protein